MGRVDLEPYVGRIVVRRRENLMSNKLDFSNELVGRRALVTGGTRGIGAAIAQRLLDAGAKVVVTARSRGEALPAGAAFVAGDVASASGVNAIARGALDALGGLDILVNSAGGASGFPQGTASIPDEEWQAGFALNLFAAIRLTNALLPALRESKAGGAPPDLFAKDIPLGRYGAPEDVAEVVALLVSGRGNWLTGGNIHVDGGMSAR
jgi:NAD(P)-dependent dehydrogenase (short-subunit alcohol dehydrogenase family)